MDWNDLRISLALAREGALGAGVDRIDLGEPPPSGRDTWVGYHRDLKRLARLRALPDLMIERLAN